MSDKPNPLAAGSPMPASIGRCADFLHDVRDLRLAMEKECAAIKSRESEIKSHIIDNLSKSADTGAAGLRYRAQITIEDVIRVQTKGLDGWGLLHSWIRKNDRFDMLQKRLSDKAVMDWCVENKRLLPGTEQHKVPDVSITKIGR